jgi:hypothetical protein
MLRAKALHREAHALGGHARMQRATTFRIERIVVTGPVDQKASGSVTPYATASPGPVSPTLIEGSM